MGLETLVLAGLGTMAAGQVMQGMAAKQAGKDEASLAEYNARVMESQAKAKEEQTLAIQKRQAEAAARVQSSLEAELGASGVVSTAGTPLLVQAKQASELELENLMIGYEGQVEAERYRSQAAGERYKGKLAKRRGKNEMFGSLLGAGGTLLTGFGMSGKSGIDDWTNEGLAARARY